MERTVLQSVSLFVTILGFVVMLGWLLGIEPLIQVSPAWTPMQFNTALGFSFVGIALGASSIRARMLSTFAAAAAFALGGLSLAQYMLGANLGLDELFVQSWVTKDSPHPGRMSPPTSAAFGIVGAAVILAGHRWGSALTCVGAAVVASLGLVSLLGYLSPNGVVLGWGSGTRMAVHTSLGFVAAAIGVTYLIPSREVRSDTARWQVPMTWSPLAAFAFVLTASLSSFHGLREQESSMLRAKTAANADLIANIMQIRLEQWQRAIDRMASRYGEDPNTERWEVDAENHLLDFPAATFLAIVQDDGDVLEFRSIANEAPQVTSELLLSLRPTVRRAIQSNSTCAMPFISDGRGTISALASPIPLDDGRRASLVAPFNLDRLVETAESEIDQQMSIQFPIESAPIEELPFGDGRAEHTVGVGDQSWMLGVQVSDLSSERSPLPFVVAGVGILFSLTLALSMRLAIISIGQARERRRINEDLESRNAEILDQARLLELQKIALDEHAIVAFTEPNGVISYVNGQFCKISKYSESELIGETHRIVNSGTHDKSFFTEMWRTIAKGETWKGEICDRAKDGSLYWVRTTIVPYKGSDGRISKFVTVRTDVTELRRAEQSLLAANEELRQFAYVASHDLQEPLRSISSHLELVRDECSDLFSEDALLSISFAVEGASRLKRLIGDLLAYSRVDSRGVALRPVDLRESVTVAMDALEAARVETGATIDVGMLPVVQGDPVQMAQLLQNLIGNAIKYRGARSPHISIDARLSSGMWLVSVTDNGIGFDQAYTDRIFQVFQRLHTRDEYQGTGIGLAICKRIVERHGGRISATSNPGSGSTFTFTLTPAQMETQDAGTQLRRAG